MIKQLLLVTAIVLGHASIAQHDIPAARFLHLLENGQYVTLMNEALALRDTAYGKNYVVDWFIAKAIYCSDHHERAGEWFRKIQQRYTLPRNFGQFLAAEIAECDAASATCPPVLDGPSPASTTRGIRWSPSMAQVDPAGTHDKMGRVMECKTVIPMDDFTSEQTNLNKVLPVVPLGDTVAFKALRNAIDGAYVADTAGRFIILARPGYMDKRAVRIASEKLTRAFDFYVRRYGFTPPPFYITAGLVAGNEELKELGGAAHGLRVPDRVLGYSSLADMTMFGTANTLAIATLYHELFHLLVRADAGDIPAWLDEGVASVYESSIWQDDDLNGLYSYPGNFRLDMLRKAARYPNDDIIIPALRELFAFSWDEFDGKPGGSGCVPAINYALAKHFALFLQDSSLLVPMVTAFSADAALDEDGVPEVRDDIVMLERVMGRSVSKVQTDFNMWFIGRYGSALYP